MTDREDMIRQRAYSIWEKEGYPSDRHEDHWHRAVAEVEGAAAAPAKKAAPKRRKAPSGAPAPSKPAPKTAKSRAPSATARKRTTKKS